MVFLPLLVSPPCLICLCVLWKDSGDEQQEAVLRIVISLNFLRLVIGFDFSLDAWDLIFLLMCGIWQRCN